MSSICGRINLDKKALAKDLIRQMCQAASIPQGGNTEGLYLSTDSNSNVIPAALGIRQPDIIDPAKRDGQPIHNEDKSVWMALNGAIYNSQSLREDLQKKGHSFYTTTGTESIVHLYEEYGADCPKHLRGTFAFALWDNNKKQLLLARDRLGKKPLYYARVNNSLLFGSELKSILLNPEIKKELDYEALDHYLAYYYVPAPLTIFKQIRKLPPASYLLCDAAGNTTVEKYWQLDYRQKTIMSTSEYCQKIMNLLEETTKIRMIGDAPLGAILSGGIDSAAVVGMMTRHSSRPIKTLSIGFSESDYSELKYSRLVADHFKTEHLEIIVKPEVIDILPALIGHFSEPFGDSSMLAGYYAARETRKYIAVALNGDGADDNFAGYPRFLAQKLMSGTAIRSFSKIIHHLTPAGLGGADPKKFFSRLKRFTKVANLPPAERYLQWQLCLTEANRQKLYQPWLKNEISKTGHKTEDYLLNIFNNAWARTPLDKMLYCNMASYLPDDLLVKMDIAGTANSLETRSPFLDQKLVKFAAQIPDHLKIKGFTLKYILKRALKGFLPDQILLRGKKDSGVPVSKWFRNELKDYACQTLLSEQAKKRDYLRPEAIQNLIDEHNSGKADNGARLWALLTLELWFRKFIDGC